MLLYILLGFLAAGFIFDRATRKYLNPYKLYFIFGKKGAGKTTYETKLAYQYLKKGWNVYTDLPELFVPGVRYFPYEQLGDFVPEENSLLILGEAGIKFDNRHFKTFKPSLRDFFAFQRKYKVICYMDSQTFDVDKKIRDRTDAMFLQVNLARVFSVGKRITKKIKLVEASAEGESRIAEDLVFAPFWTWTFTYIPRWAGKFDCHPFRSSERGSNENANRLIRRYFRKGESLAHRTQKDCDIVARTINSMHRKVLGYRTAEEVFREHLSTLQ